MNGIYDEPVVTSRRYPVTKIVTLAMVLFCLVAFKGEQDPLHKRVFNISLTEIKGGVPAKKVIADQLDFKNGKLYSAYLDEKLGYKWIPYRINKDSIYIDSTDTEVRLLVVEATATSDDNQTVNISFEQVEWDIDGVIKITKNDKPKKYFDFVGREKGGKPKKVKKKKDQEEQNNGQTAPGEPPK